MPGLRLVATAPQTDDRDEEGREEDLSGDGDDGGGEDGEPLLSQRPEVGRGPAPDHDPDERQSADPDECGKCQTVLEA